MAGPRSPLDALSPGKDAMGRDAERLARIYPAPPEPAPASWHPEPLTISPVVANLAQDMPDFVN